ncbi:MAG: glycosyltransferase family 2 protein [Verrucomicrobia bacterium]|nr:glycosyltransferase family 2 protein [Verrucomicrobiota bacterium]MBR5606712.1 glycosyltransferase family 2 protein [Verrucomicrobiota bacterium]MBR5691112.1 glycosyltransferase family 2 protein [Verrucomicrobiota bacterium]MBR5737218.1 glycosyltransferase family 2 protein [Verrucomicrobiota bacterium]MBR5978999.1 glycosyltransferase family 2 protein [Verrucomicrobiota bacterium]
MEQEDIDISVVIPVYNEEENVGPLMQELDEALTSTGKKFEVICVNDASTDGSLTTLKELRGAYPWLRIIDHTVNSGESAGEATGMQYARGAIVITMDADQQMDPADIPAFLEAMKPEVTAVCGVRRKRQDDFVRRMSTKIANAYRNWITGDKITDAGCTYRAIRREALREIPVFNGMHRFLPTMLRYQGYRVEEIYINHRPRTRGVSKYGVGNRLWRGIKDCLGMRWYRSRVVKGGRSHEV